MKGEINAVPPSLCAKCKVLFSLNAFTAFALLYTYLFPVTLELRENLLQISLPVQFPGSEATFSDLEMSSTTVIPGHFSLGGHALTPLLQCLSLQRPDLLVNSRKKPPLFMDITIIAFFRLVKLI